MEELIWALERLLERGIIVEPIGAAGALRIRLENEEPTQTVEQPDNNARGGLTW